MHIRLAVFFDAPFWVGVFERTDEGTLETARIVFGAEPKDYEVYDFITLNLNGMRYSRPIEVLDAPALRINPKRLQRIIQRETALAGIGTKAQQALKLEHEAAKQERKKLSREEREQMERIKFQMRQEKKKEKKKGH